MVEMPAIIDGKKTTVQLTDNRARFVKLKAQALEKGERLPDSTAYQIAYNRTDEPQNNIGGHLIHSVTKNRLVNGALDYIRHATANEFTPEESAKLFKQTIYACDAEKRQPLFETYYKLQGGAYSRDEQPTQNIQINLNNFEKID